VQEVDATFHGRESQALVDGQLMNSMMIACLAEMPGKPAG
jgi:hypothetical protein